MQGKSQVASARGLDAAANLPPGVAEEDPAEAEGSDQDTSRYIKIHQDTELVMQIKLVQAVAFFRTLQLAPAPVGTWSKVGIDPLGVRAYFHVGFPTVSQVNDQAIAPLSAIDNYVTSGPVRVPN